MEKIIKKNELSNYLKYLDNYDFFELIVDNSIFFGKKNNMFYFFKKGKNYDIRSEGGNFDLVEKFNEFIFNKLNEKISISYNFFNDLF